jgi:predicted peroxiredoxin
MAITPPARPYILYVGSWAEKNKKKDTYQAALLFAAATAMADYSAQLPAHEQVDVAVALLGDAVRLMRDSEAQQMAPGAHRPDLKQAIGTAAGKGVRIYC